MKNKDISKADSSQQPLVALSGKRIQTNSLIVAGRLGKRHDNVVQKIIKLIDEDDVSFLNFKERNGFDARGKEQRYYEMDRDSFSVLMMGFTGQKAFQWKVSFLKAFNQMEQELLRRQSPEFQEIRQIGKISRRLMTDAIQAFVEYARAQGSGNADRYYLLFTRLIYRELFGLNKAPDNFRDALPERASHRLTNIEEIISDWIHDAMAESGDYHDVYQSVKDRLKRYVDVTGRLFPVEQLAA
ncbi:MAG: Rha family transcriptional regulator [Desulfamplus sp.]|nr:Rha family transcriptional regulator [Desulfamplus sp.]